MSWQEASRPQCLRRTGVVELVIEPASKDLGGFTVRRVLPSPERKMVGPFIFIDEMGPARFSPGQGMNVRPHPHIGLATVTYLFEGEILHRDSLGYVQPIEPGAINLMTAGRGIVHSERTAPELLAQARPLHGIQTWMALPLEHEEADPAFEHYPAERLPALVGDGLQGRVIIGAAYGLESPVRTLTPALYVHVDLDAGATLELPMAEALALYVVTGQVELGECSLPAGRMGVLRKGARAHAQARESSRIILVGGDDIGDRHIWWNLVSSRRERIEQAKEDWRMSRFDRVPGDDEFIPLPDDR